MERLSAELQSLPQVGTAMNQVPKGSGAREAETQATQRTES